MDETAVLGLDVPAFVETLAVGLALLGAVVVLVRKYFRQIMGSLVRTEAQVQNGHGDSPSLRDDIDSLTAKMDSLIAGQRDQREDLLDLRRRVDTGFAEVRGDVRRLHDADAALSTRVTHLEYPEPAPAR